MKTKLFSLILALATSVGTIVAERAKIGVLYYELNEEYLTAEVTCQDGSEDNYSGLTSIDIPSSVTSHSNQTYRVTSIGSCAFYRCTGLMSVTIPNSVTSIGNWAFNGCSGLTSVTIPYNVTSIGEEAFYDCSGLTSIIIPNSVTSIGAKAFRNCSGLPNVTIPSSIKYIGDCAFEWCTSLTKVNIDNVAAWCATTFIGLFSNPLFYAQHLYLNDDEIVDLVIPNNTTSIGNYAFEFCSGLKTVTIPDCVTNIGNSAFEACSDLASLSIPNSVTSIGKYAFHGCSNLINIAVESGNTSYDSRDNCNAVIETKSNTLIVGCQNTTIPNSVTSIGGSAFSGRTGLASVEIPNSVTSIGEYAFLNCSGLTSVSIPNKVTSIGLYAFGGCSGLESITTEPVVPPTCGEYTFAGVDKSIPLYVPLNSMDAYGAANQWKDFTNIQAIANDIDEVMGDIERLNRRRIIRDGQLLILRDGKTYTIQGQEVK